MDPIKPAANMAADPMHNIKLCKAVTPLSFIGSLLAMKTLRDRMVIKYAIQEY